MNLFWPRHFRGPLASRVADSKEAARRAADFLFMFERQRIGKPPEDPAVSASQTAIRAANNPPHVRGRAEHFEFSGSETPLLSLDLGPMSSTSVTGEDRLSYSLDLNARISSDDGEQASALLHRLALVRQGETLVLQTPPNLGRVQSQVYLDVLSAADRAVVVFGVRASVTVSTNHGRISLLNNSGTIDARAAPGGSIAFAADKGRVHLFADSIDIKVGSRSYIGTIEAEAEGLIRALLPRGFAGGFEANVRNSSLFLCRADLGAELQYRKESKRFAVKCGAGKPQLRFCSQQGAVVVDTA